MLDLHIPYILTTTSLNIDTTEWHSNATLHIQDEHSISGTSIVYMQNYLFHIGQNEPKHST